MAPRRNTEAFKPPLQSLSFIMGFTESGFMQVMECKLEVCVGCLKVCVGCLKVCVVRLKVYVGCLKFV